MRLRELTRASTLNMVLYEGFDPSKEEKLGFIQMMVAKQGKDPAAVVNRIRGLIDPEYARQEGQKRSFKDWVTKALKDETKEGRAYGRRVRVTVLESVVRDMITEGFFSDVGKVITAKLRDLLGDEYSEDKLVGQALDQYPQLAALHRYSNKATGFLYDDEKFWELVNRVTDNKGKEIRRIVQGTFPRLEESRRRHSVFSECIIVEARISEVMAELGLEPNWVSGIMRQYDIRDDDYDLARLKDAWQRAQGNVQKAIEFVKEIPGQAAQAMKDLPQSASKMVNVQRVREENRRVADEVIKIAAVMMQVIESGAETPQEVQQVVQQVASGNLSGVKPPSSEVSTSDLGVNV